MTRTRRDPRRERADRVVAGGLRPRFDLKGAPQSHRPRRNPRAERDARRVEAANSRFDMLLESDPAAQVARVSAQPAAAEGPRAKPATIILAEPAFTVLVVPDLANGGLSVHDRQLLGAAGALAGSDGAVVALAPMDCAGLEAAGADRHVSSSALPSSYDPDGLAAAIIAAMTVLSPRHVVFAESPDGGDLARRIAASTGEALFTDAEAVTPRLLRRAAHNRRIEQSAAPPRLITVAPGAVAPYAGAPHEARLVELAIDEVTEADPGPIVASSVVHANPATVPLALADFVVSAGNGITDFVGFNALATALAATPGASRVLCDAGLMPRDRQVGASGTVLAASCYFALGIAGAPQHLQGVADCAHVVAVNTDLHAAMIERADLAIVQDAQLVMPALLAMLASDAAAPT